MTFIYDGSGPEFDKYFDSLNPAVQVIGYQQNRGKGYAEALTRATQHLFADDHLICYALASNTSSLRVFEKCHFRRAGEARWYTSNPLALSSTPRHG